MLDIEIIRQDFPALAREIAGRPVIYLDSAATYLKPNAVIDAVCQCYRETAGTIGRGVHVMAEDAIERYDEARETIANFINADADEIIFVRNATEAINLVASSMPEKSSILGSVGEHHSNLLPWRHRHQFHTLPMTDEGQIDLSGVAPVLADFKPDLVAVSSIGNAFGNVQPVEELIAIAHDAGVDVMLDVNQSIAHRTIDVRKLDCEYLCFSGHKLGGPTGVGVLYAKRDQLERLQPMMMGGGVVESVSETGHVLSETPMRLEAGTPAFESVIGLAAACDYFEDLGLANVHQHENELVGRLIDGLDSIPRIVVRGPRDPSLRGAIVSFHIEGLEAHGAARMLSKRANLCLRSGFHCAEMAHGTQGWRPTIRASFGVYNTNDEVDVLLDSLRQITTNLG